MNRHGLFTSLVLVLVTGPAFADTCSDIVEATVAELRAGAGARWSDEADGLARAAAGSACVKAVSGRYDEAPPVIREEPVAEGASAEAAAAAPAEGAVADDGSWTVGGMTFRSLSGSPSKKPYQRQREQRKEDEEQ